MRAHFGLPSITGKPALPCPFLSYPSSRIVSSLILSSLFILPASFTCVYVCTCDRVTVCLPSPSTQPLSMNSHLNRRRLPIDFRSVIVISHIIPSLLIPSSLIPALLIPSLLIPSSYSFSLLPSFLLPLLPLPSSRALGEDAEHWRAPIEVKFEIPYFTVSGLQVRYVLSATTHFATLQFVTV